jgi:hypothetical protein
MSTEVQVTRLPECDFCREKGLSVPAKYDSKTKVGPWANCCEEHWQQWGVGRLGTGFGQRLVLMKDAEK